MKKIKESRQNNGERGKNRTRRKLVLELFIGAIRSYASVYIQTGHFTQNRSFLSVHSEKKLILLVIPGLFHILTLIIIFTKHLKLMPRPAPSSPPLLFSPIGGGAFANFALPGNWAFANPWLFPSFWHARGFILEYNYTVDITGKKSRLADLSRRGRCKGMFSIICMHFFIAYQARITYPPRGIWQLKSPPVPGNLPSKPRKIANARGGGGAGRGWNWLIKLLRFLCHCTVCRGIFWHF